MQPALALAYSSGNTGNGSLGVGWTIEGTSEIRRCHKTKLEGLPDGIDWDNDDDFCLNGQRLARVNPEQNGLDGAEFRLEHDDFTKIVAHGDTAAGPDSFTVYTKNGRILEYETRVEPHRFQGSFEDTPVADLGPVRAVWLLSSLRDRSKSIEQGNTMRYDYDILQNASTGGVEVRIKSIVYTETYDGDPGKRSIEFEYTEDREDPTFRYESGVRWETSSLLDKITLRGPDPTITGTLGEYRFKYEQSPDTDRSMLSSVTRCDGNDACLRAKKLAWWYRTTPGAPPVEFDDVGVTPLTSVAGMLPDNLIVADFNGDGLDDVLYRATYVAGYKPIYMHLAQKPAAGGLSFSAEIETNPLGHPFSVVDLARSRAADVDGDGRTELLAALDPALANGNIQPEPGYIVFEWDDDASEFVIPQGAQFLYGDPLLDIVQLTDVDGDGLVDILREEPDLGGGSGATDFGTWLLLHNNGGSFDEPQSTNLLSLQGGLARAMDIDGDGRGELLPIDWETVPDGTLDESIIPGATIALGMDDNGDVATNPVWRLQTFNRLELVDLNGDGLRDALYPANDETRVRWNLGNGFGPMVPLPSDVIPPPSSAFYPDIGLRAADFDGDGIEDFVSFDNDDPPTFERVRLHRLRDGHIVGDDLGFAGTAPLQHDEPNGGPQNVQDGWPTSRLGDFNGDGLVDILHTYIIWTTDENGGAQATFQLRALVQAPSFSDILFEISDEDAPTPAESVFYKRTPVDAAPSCTFPQVCIRRGIPVVTETATAAGGIPSPARYKYYSYDDPRMDLWGRGFLGFGKVTVFDPQLRAQTITTFDHETKLDTYYPYAGLPKHIQHIATIFDAPTDDMTEWPILPPGPHQARITDIENTYELVVTTAGGSYLVHPIASTTIEQEREVSIGPESIEIVGPPDPTHRVVDTVTFYDAYDNPTFVFSATQGGTYRYANNLYANDEEQWLLGLPTRSEVVAEDVSNPAAEARVTEYQYDDNGLPWFITVEPDHPEMKQITRFARNDDGLVTRVDVSTDDGTRKSFFAYDDFERMFPRATWNQRAHYERYAYHPGYGLAVLAEDPNGVQVASSYDGFGRIRRVLPAGGTASSISYLSDDCRTDDAAMKGICQSIEGDDGAKQVAYMDEYGRTREVAHLGADGELVFQEQLYNVFGQPIRSTRPFKQYVGAVTTTTFDTLSRPRSIQRPDGGTTSFVHTMYSTLRIDAEGHTSSVVFDKDGRVVESSDVSSTPTVYGYGPFDQIVSIQDPLGNTTWMTHDKLGRRIRLDDPDQGTTLFEYNGFGEQVYSQHLVSETPLVVDLATEYQYDNLGRLRYRIDTVDNDPSSAETTELRYDGQAHGLGKLRRSISPDGIETAHSYDEFGRLKVTEWTIDGELYKFERTYDPDFGRLERLRYPDGGSKTFEFGTTYTPSGWLSTVRRHQNGPAYALWTVNERNLDGAVTVATWPLANMGEIREYSGLTGRVHGIQVKGDNEILNLTYNYDLVGNVTYRRDWIADRAESFLYDDTDRLEQWDLEYLAPNGSHKQRTSNYQYDDLGNVTATFVDGILEELHEIDPVRPHRLASIDFLQGAGVRTYFHDTRGRVDQDTAGRQIEYTPFDLPRHIGQPGKEAHFAYDAFGSRVKKTASDGGVLTTTITLAGLYERRERIESGKLTVQHVYYVHGDDGPVAQVLYDEGEEQETIAYLARDGLGSIGAVFDKNGDLVERLFHEPFGQRVGQDGASLPSFVSLSDVSLGFTGHRHDDDLGLIDMRGRVYDPVQKRFLTPDPFVPHPLSSQSYNRYAYVLNNPLSYIDPSGFQELKSSWLDRVIVEIGLGALKAVETIKQWVKSDPPKAEPPKQPAGGSSDGRGKEEPKGPEKQFQQPTKPPPPDPTKEEKNKKDDPFREEIPPYNAAAHRSGGVVAGAMIAGVPFGGLVAVALMNAGVLGKGTPAAQEGLAEGMAAGGMIWMAVGLGQPKPPASPTPAMAGGGPAPPVVVQVSGAGVVAGTGTIVNTAVGVGELTGSLSTGGGSSPDPTTKVVTNSAGQQVTRTLVKNEDQLLKAAEDAAGGSLDKWQNFKPNWWKSPDGQTKIEFNLDGHRSTNEGPHVAVHVADGKGGWRVSSKVFIEGRESF